MSFWLLARSFARPPLGVIDSTGSYKISWLAYKISDMTLALNSKTTTTSRWKREAEADEEKEAEEEDDDDDKASRVGEQEARSSRLCFS